MLLGMKAQCEGKNIQEIKAETKVAVKKFNELFIARHGSLKCKKLLGVDISTAEGSEKANEMNLFNTICSDLVGSAAEILEKEF